MFRLTRPLYNQVLRTSTGISGLAVHPNPLPELTKAYESTLSLLATIPSTSIYRQGVEALTQHKLKIVQDSKGDIAQVEKQLDEGLIEQALDVANDELSLVSKMIEWKAYAFYRFAMILLMITSVFPLDGSPWKTNLSRVSGSISGKLPPHRDLLGLQCESSIHLFITGTDRLINGSIRYVHP
jgi:NADH dehydrogenase (ubiquinone) 1 alpha subcomplex subunit 5